MNRMKKYSKNVNAYFESSMLKVRNKHVESYIDFLLNIAKLSLLK